MQCKGAYRYSQVSADIFLASTVHYTWVFHQSINTVDLL